MSAPTWPSHSNPPTLSTYTPPSFFQFRQEAGRHNRYPASRSGLRPSQLPPPFPQDPRDRLWSWRWGSCGSIFRRGRSPARPTSSSGPVGGRVPHSFTRQVQESGSRAGTPFSVRYCMQCDLSHANTTADKQIVFGFLLISSTSALSRWERRHANTVCEKNTRKCTTMAEGWMGPRPCRTLNNCHRSGEGAARGSRSVFSTNRMKIIVHSYAYIRNRVTVSPVPAHCGIQYPSMVCPQSDSFACIIPRHRIPPRGNHRATDPRPSDVQ